METSHHVRGAPPKAPKAGLPSLGDYANLRRGGAGGAQARGFLRLGGETRPRMGRGLRGQVGRGAGEAQPRFARHDKHVAAVMGQGGFPALTERRIGRNGVCVGLPLLWPETSR